jgi:glutaredoxin-related protein
VDFYPSFGTNLVVVLVLFMHNREKQVSINFSQKIISNLNLELTLPNNLLSSRFVGELIKKYKIYTTILKQIYTEVAGGIRIISDDLMGKH